jgi:hypothetical protein
MGELARWEAVPTEESHLWQEQRNLQLDLWGPTRLKVANTAHGISDLLVQVVSCGRRKWDRDRRKNKIEDKSWCQCGRSSRLYT